MKNMPINLWLSAACISFTALTGGCGLAFENSESQFLKTRSVRDKVHFSKEAGFYNGTIQVELSSNNPNDSIYYTLDGTEPTFNGYRYKENGVTKDIAAGTKYTNPILLDNNTLIRARVCRDDLSCGRDAYNTYFINEPTTLPVMSLAIEPLHLFDELSGIYTSGNNKSNPKVGQFDKRNFYQDWERPVHIEYFDTDRKLGFEMDAGVQIFGFFARSFSHKSLSIFAKADYGYDSIPNKFFTVSSNVGPINSLKSIVLRNSGDDWFKTMFRDGLMQELMGGLGLDKQGYRPAVVFINGFYWGIHNIREKINENYLASHYNYVNPQAVDILQDFNAAIVEGDNREWLNLIAFIKQSDMSIEQNYNFVRSKIDINNFINYVAAQMYINNTDWPAQNMKVWKPQNTSYKWRFLVFDVDQAFHGLNGPRNHYNYDTFQFVLDRRNDAGVGAIFYNLYNENPAFKAEFVKRLREIRESHYKPSIVHAKISEIENVLSAEIPRHQARWSGSASDWSAKVQLLRDFASNRYTYSETMIQAHE